MIEYTKTEIMELIKSTLEPHKKYYYFDNNFKIEIVQKGAT